MFAERFLFARDYQRGQGRWTSDGDLANELGLASQSEISAYKKRDIAPGADKTLAIAKRTGVDPGWLAFGEDTAAPAPDNFATWLENKRTAEPTRALRLAERSRTAYGAPEPDPFADAGAADIPIARVRPFEPDEEAEEPESPRKPAAKKRAKGKGGRR